MRASIVRAFPRRAPAPDTDVLVDAAARLNIRDLAIRRDRGRTVITGVARYELDRDLFFEAVKQLDGWASDIVVDLAVERHDVRGYYTVRPGDTLASIARQHLGSAARERDIFEANRDRMNDPDQIFPGQQLLIPWR